MSSTACTKKIDCPCGANHEKSSASEGSGYKWKDGIPRKNWMYDGFFIEHDAVDGSCEMCDHSIKYEHQLTHPTGLKLGVGCVCGNKMIQEGALKNRTGEKKLSNSDPYSPLSNTKWPEAKNSKKIQFKLRKGSALHTRIVSFLKIDPSSKIFVYPNGGIYCPTRVITEEEKADPVFSGMKGKIAEAYQKSLNLKK